MSIADELREYANTRISPNKGMLTAIADRIDAEHERAVTVAHSNGITEYGSMVAREFVKLPKDADGEYIHVGDVMRFGSAERDLTVLGFGVPDVDGNDYGVFVLGGDDYTWYNASFLRHHKPPTVEDVLREMHAEIDEVTALYVGEVIDSDERDRDEARIFAKYAAKLRLAGDAE